jgi:hypothetical protein
VGLLRPCSQCAFPLAGYLDVGCFPFVLKFRHDNVDEKEMYLGSFKALKVECGYCYRLPGSVSNFTSQNQFSVNTYLVKILLENCKQQMTNRY